MSLELFEQIKNDNYNIVLIGDKQDNINNNKYHEFLDKENINVQHLSKKTNISEFIDLIGSLDLLITIDSSAMHIVAATQTPFLVLIGKGTSAFDTVCPKVKFGNILFSGKDKIQDKHIIEAITPQEIRNKINEVLNNIK